MASQTLGFIGCAKKPTNQPRNTLTTPGNMGGAVLNGILAAAFSNQDIIKVVSGQNVSTMREADVVILGCRPIHGKQGAQRRGRACSTRWETLYQHAGGWPAGLGEGSVSDAKIMKIVPNMGAQFDESMTIIETPSPGIEREMVHTVEWIFNQVGKGKYLAPGQTGLATVLVGATLAALTTLPIEGLLDGCVAEGLKRANAMEMVLQGIRGLSAVLEFGSHPAAVRESISSPRGCTIQTLLSLEKAGTRSDFAEAMIKGNKHLKENM